MSLVLRYKIYGLRESDDYSSESDDWSGRLQRDSEDWDHISDDVSYACLYWTTHFSLEKITDPWIVEQFLRKHFFNWVELMILMWRLPDVQSMLANLENTLRDSPFLSNDPMFGSDGLELLELVKRARSFLRRNFKVLFRNPLDVYVVGRPDERSLFGQGIPSSLVKARAHWPYAQIW